MMGCRKNGDERNRVVRGGLGRLTALALAACSPWAASAFDSAEWHGKRELFAREAERLKAAYTNCVANLRETAENVTIPVETYENGAEKVVVQARKAQYFLDQGLVWGEGVVVRRFKPDGSTEARIDARHCVIDREAKSGWAEGPARVIHGSTTFLGKGVYFSAADSYVKVTEDSAIDSKDLKFGGLRP